MNEKQTDELGHWFSTYGLITAERILNIFHIVLSKEELAIVLKKPEYFYYYLLQVPLKNVLNGIILQQASDYHVYAQKLFIDYLLSAEANKGEEAQGAITRGAMEEERILLVTLGEDFNQLEIAHNTLIASSQAALIKLAQEWNKILKSSTQRISRSLKQQSMNIQETLIHNSIHKALIDCKLSNSSENTLIFIDKMNEHLNLPLSQEIKQLLAPYVNELILFILQFNENIKPYLTEVKEMKERIQSFRTQFYETILRVVDLLKLLPEYKINVEKDAINKESLYFDKSIGVKNKIVEKS